MQVGGLSPDVHTVYSMFHAALPSGTVALAARRVARHAGDADTWGTGHSGAGGGSRGGTSGPGGRGSGRVGSGRDGGAGFGGRYSGSPAGGSGRLFDLLVGVWRGMAADDAVMFMASLLRVRTSIDFLARNFRDGCAIPR